MQKLLQNFNFGRLSRLALSFCLVMVMAMNVGWGQSTYTKVTTAPSDWSGTYVIVADASSVIFTGQSGSNNYGGYDNVTITNNQVTGNFTSYEVEIAQSGNYYSIKHTSSSKYLGWTSGNTLYFSSTAPEANSYRWMLSTSSILNANDNSRKLQYNSGSPRFACYTSSQKVAYLYKKEVNTSAVSTPTISPNGGSFLNSQEITLACATEGAIIHYTTDGTTPTTSSTQYTAPFTINATTTVKAIAVKSGYDDSNVATAEFTKEQPLANIATLTANTTAGTYFVTLTNAVVTYVNGNYAYIQDASGAIAMYKSGHGLTAGDVLNGTAVVTYQLHSSNPQITDLSGVTPDSGTEPNPTIVAQSAWNYTFNNVLSQYFQITDATITKSNSKYYIFLGDESVQLYKVSSSIPELDLNRTYTITGFPTLYNTTKELQIFDNPVVEEVAYPVINANNNVEIAYDATSSEIAYTVENPVQGTSLEATSTADWISNIVVGASAVTFTTTVNEGTEDRTATITLSYAGATNKIVTVTQGHFVVDYATLPFTFDGGRDDITNTTGLTQEGLGGDYSSSPKLKFDGTDDYLVLKFNEQPGTLTFDIKGNGSGSDPWSGTFIVQTSEDGVNYSDLQTYTTLVDVQSEEFNNLGADVRYIKWIYTNKSLGNVALGNISLTAYTVPQEYTLTVSNLNHVNLFIFGGDESETIISTEDGDVTAQVTAGTNVEISVDVESGYVIQSLMVDGVEHVSDIDADLYMFTMPSHDVTISATAVENVPPTPTAGSWVLTNLADLTADDVFVIVGNNGDTYAMSNDEGTQNPPAAVAVTVVNNTLSGEPADNIKWNVSGNATDGYTFYPNGDTDSWLYCTNTNNGVRVGANTNKTFVVSNGYLKHDATSRYVGVYNSSDWRCYSISNPNEHQNIGGQTFAFYKKVEDPNAVSITADNEDIVYNATSGNIAYTINNVPDPAGTLTAAVQQGATIENLVLGTITSTAVPFTCDANNTGTDRTAVVTLTYTYGDNETVTVTKDVTITQAAAPQPSIIVDPVAVNVDADEHDGTITVTYNNITDVVANVWFCNAEGTAAATYDWFDADINAQNNIEYIIDANTGSARTAYFKVFAAGNQDFVYSNLVTVTQAGNPNVVDHISDINQVGASYTVRGTVVATNNKGFVVGDGTGYVYYFKGSSPTQVVNDVVTISGTTTSYGHVIQFGSSATVTAATTSDYNGTPAVSILDAAGISAYNNDYQLSDYVQYEGVLTQEGNNYIITVGENAIARISYPTYAQETELTSLLNQTVRVKGYFSGFAAYNNNPRFTTMLKSVEVAGTAINAQDVTVDYNATSGSIEYTINDPVEGGVLTATTDSEWLTVGQVDGTAVHFACTANDAAARTATVTMTYTYNTNQTVTKTVVVTQSANPNLTSGTICFGSTAPCVKISNSSVVGQDALNNNWTITTEGTTSFTQHSDCSQIGSSNSPASSITFSTTLPNAVNITELYAQFGGYNGTAGTVTLKIDGNIVGTGSLNGSDDVIVSNDNTLPVNGTNLTVTITDIQKGVKCYYINYSYAPQSHRVYFYEGTGDCSVVSLKGSSVELPVATIASADWTFAGWSEAPVNETATAPSMVSSPYAPAEDLNLYAIYHNAATGKYYSFPTIATTELDVTEGFETYTDAQPENDRTFVKPTGWTVVTQYDPMAKSKKGRPQVFYASSVAHNSTYSLLMDSLSLVAMPRLADNVVVSSLEMELYVRQSKNCHALEVGVMSDLTDISSFEHVATINNEGVAVNYHKVDFGSYDDDLGGRYIVFRNYYTSPDEGVKSFNYLDDIVLRLQSDACGITELPYENNFDGADETAEMSCWTVANKDYNYAENYAPQISSASLYSQSGSNTLLLDGRCIYAMPVLKAVDEASNEIVSVQDLRLEFYVSQADVNRQLQVGVMSDLNDATTFVVLKTVSNNGVPDPQKHVVDFASYAGDYPDMDWALYKHIAFRNIYEGTWGRSPQYIDNVRLYKAEDEFCGVTLPYENSFDETSEVAEMSCWTLVQKDYGFTDTYAPQISEVSAYANSGSNSLLLDGRCLYAMPELRSSDPDESVDVLDVRMEFHVFQPSVGRQLQVGVMSDLEDIATFKVLETVSNGGVSGQQHHVLNFSGLASMYPDVVDWTSYKYIAFRNIYDGTWSRSPQYIDDIRLDIVSEDACGITLPYENTFEATDEVAEISCWTLVKKDYGFTDTYAPQISEVSAYANSGSNSLLLDGRCLYAMPELRSTDPGESVSMSTVRMEFYVFQPSASRQLQVGVMTDVNNPNTFVVLETITNEGASGQVQHVVDFGQYASDIPAGAKYIAFRNVYDGTWGRSPQYLDDITLSLATTAPDAVAEIPQTQGEEPEEYVDDSANTDFEEVMAPTGISDFDLSNLTVYPNPTTGMVTIVADEVSRVEVYNQIGVLVARYTNEQVIDLGNLSSGIYVLRVTTPQGVAIRKVVKK